MRDGSVGVTAAYHASRAAVINLTRNAAMTYANEKIRLNATCPGLMNTPMVQNQDKVITDKVLTATPMDLWADPREIATKSRAAYLGRGQPACCRQARTWKVSSKIWKAQNTGYYPFIFESVALT